MKSIRISKLAPLLAAATAGFALAPSELAAQGTVVGGSKNAAPGGISVVVGGAKNRSVGGGSVIVGGNTNRANGDNSAIVTGFQNTTGTTGKFSGIGAGSNNLITGQGSFIGSGNKNTASGLSTIVLGGTDNTCSGQFSVIGGGRRNTLAAKESFLFGNDINHNGSNTGIVYLADNSRAGTALNQTLAENTMACRFNGGLLFFADPTSATPAFLISPSGLVGIGTASPAARLHVSNGASGQPNTADFIVENNTSVTMQLNSANGQGASLNFGKNGAAGDGAVIYNNLRELVFRAGNVNRVTLEPNGHFGIGTIDPGVPLDVVGSASTTNTGTCSFYTAGATSLSTGTGQAWQASIRASSGIVAGAGYLTSSDARTKNVQGRSDATADLDKLLQLEITDYLYKDVVTKGNRPNKKVIAQQVETVFPQAVISSTNAVPDIYKKAPMVNGWIQLPTDLKLGDRVRLITKENQESVHEVLEVRDGAFRTDFATTQDEIFVFGREVKDFLTVDYDAIAMLNVSATQELARKLEAKDAELVSLKAKLAALEARDEAREDRLARLEQSLEDVARTVAVPVALSVSK